MRYFYQKKGISAFLCLLFFTLILNKPILAVPPAPTTLDITLIELASDASSFKILYQSDYKFSDGGKVYYAIFSEAQDVSSLNSLIGVSGSLQNGVMTQNKPYALEDIVFDFSAEGDYYVYFSLEETAPDKVKVEPFEAFVIDKSKPTITSPELETLSKQTLKLSFTPSETGVLNYTVSGTTEEPGSYNFSGSVDISEANKKIDTFINLLSPLSKDGDYTLTFSLEDESGNESDASDITWGIDFTSPRVVATNLNHTSDVLKSLEFRVLDEENWDDVAVYYMVTDQEIKGATGEQLMSPAYSSLLTSHKVINMSKQTVSLDLTGTLSEDTEYILYLFAKDTRGNYSTVWSADFETVKPYFVNKVSNVDSLNNSEELILLIDASEELDVSKSVINVTDAQLPYTPSIVKVPLLRNKYRITIPTQKDKQTYPEIEFTKLVDIYGNETTTEESYRWSIDRIKPVIDEGKDSLVLTKVGSVYNSETGETTFNSSNTIAFTYSISEVGLLTFKFSTNGITVQENSTFVSSTDSTIITELPSNKQFVDGKYTFEYEVIDVVGNKSKKAKIEIDADLTSPEVRHMELVHEENSKKVTFDINKESDIDKQTVFYAIEENGFSDVSYSDILNATISEELSIEGFSEVKTELFPGQPPRSVIKVKDAPIDISNLSAEKEYYFYLFVEDSAGNQSEIESIYFDTKPVEVVSVSSDLDDVEVSNANEIKFNFEFSEAVNFDISEIDIVGVEQAEPLKPKGANSYELKLKTLDGESTPTVTLGKLYDAYGNVLDYNTAFSWNIDKVKPSLQSTLPAEASIDNSTLPLLTFNYDEDIDFGKGGYVDIKVGGEIQQSYTSRDLTITDNQAFLQVTEPLAGGEEVTVEVSGNFFEDLAGNQSEPSSFTFSTSTVTVNKAPDLDLWVGGLFDEKLGAISIVENQPSDFADSDGETFFTLQAPNDFYFVNGTGSVRVVDLDEDGVGNGNNIKDARIWVSGRAATVYLTVDGVDKLDEFVIEDLELEYVGEQEESGDITIAKNSAAIIAGIDSEVSLAKLSSEAYGGVLPEDMSIRVSGIGTYYKTEGARSITVTPESDPAGGSGLLSGVAVYDNAFHPSQIEEEGEYEIEYLYKWDSAQYVKTITVEIISTSDEIDGLDTDYCECLDENSCDDKSQLSVKTLRSIPEDLSTVQYDTAYFHSFYGEGVTFEDGKWYYNHQQIISSMFDEQGTGLVNLRVSRFYLDGNGILQEDVSLYGSQQVSLYKSPVMTIEIWDEYYDEANNFCSNDNSSYYLDIYNEDSYTVDQGELIVLYNGEEIMEIDPTMYEKDGEFFPPTLVPSDLTSSLMAKKGLSYEELNAQLPITLELKYFGVEEDDPFGICPSQVSVFITLEKVPDEPSMKLDDNNGSKINPITQNIDGLDYLVFEFCYDDYDPSYKAEFFGGEDATLYVVYYEETDEWLELGTSVSPMLSELGILKGDGSEDLEYEYEIAQVNTYCEGDYQRVKFIIKKIPETVKVVAKVSDENVYKIEDGEVTFSYCYEDWVNNMIAPIYVSGEIAEEAVIEDDEVVTPAIPAVQRFRWYADAERKELLYETTGTLLTETDSLMFDKNMWSGVTGEEDVTKDFYVSQVVNDCEDGVLRKVSVIIRKVPTAITVSNVDNFEFCADEVEEYLESAVNVQGDSNAIAFNWYQGKELLFTTNASSGLASATLRQLGVDSLANMLADRTETFTVTQVVNNCEGVGQDFSIFFKRKPQPPTVLSADGTKEFTFCYKEFDTESILFTLENIDVARNDAVNQGWALALYHKNGDDIVLLKQTSERITLSQEDFNFSDPEDDGLTKEFYISQWTNGCESDLDTITIHINNEVDEPEVEDERFDKYEVLRFCETDVVEDIVLDEVPEDVIVTWYDKDGGVLKTEDCATGDCGSITAEELGLGNLPESIGAHSYTVSYTDILNGLSCEGEKMAFEINVYENPIPVISGLTEVEYCQSAKEVTLILSPSGGTLKLDDEIRGPELDFSKLTVGEHEIKYIYTNINNCTDSVSQTFIVNPVPKAHFSAVVACNAQTVTISDSSRIHESSEIAEWIVDWGDGSKTSLNASWETLEHQYETRGEKDITLSVVSVEGCSADSSSISRTVQIGSEPFVDFSVTNFCEGDITQFTDASNVPEKNELIVWNWRLYDENPELNPSAQPVMTKVIDLEQGDEQVDLEYEFEETGQFYIELEVYVKADLDGKDQYVEYEYCSDILRDSLFVYPTITVTDSYLEDFDKGNNDWFAEGQNSSWEEAIPANGQIQGTTKAWVTRNSEGTYNANERSFVYTPCFDIVLLNKPMLKFDAQVRMEAGKDGAVLQYYGDDAQWHTVGDKGTGLNWYNFNNVTADPEGTNGSRLGWSDSLNHVGEWTSVRHYLDDIQHIEKVQFRVQFASNSDTEVEGGGMALDNFWIGNRQKNVLFENFFYAEDNAYVSDLTTLVDVFNKDGMLINYTVGKPGEVNTIPTLNASGRATYYGVSSYSRSVLDGNQLNTEMTSDNINLIEGQPLYGFRLKQRALEDVIFDLNLSYKGADELEGTVMVDVSLVNELETEQEQDDEIVVHIATLERHSLTSNDWKLVGMSPHAGGTNLLDSVTNWTVGQSLRVNIPWNKLDVDDAATDIVLLAYVQNNRTREIYQSQYVVVDNYLPSSAVTDLALIEDESQLTVYPNPAHDYIRFKLPEPISRTAHWEFTTIDGKTVREGVLSKGVKTPQLDVSGLPTGVYLLKLATGEQGGTYYAKIHIQ